MQKYKENMGEYIRDGGGNVWEIKYSEQIKPMNFNLFCTLQNRKIKNYLMGYLKSQDDEAEII